MTCLPLSNTGGGPAQGKGAIGVGPLRLWPGGLCLSRAIGDFDVGDTVLSLPYISQVSDCTVRPSRCNIPWGIIFNSCLADRAVCKLTPCRLLLRYGCRQRARGCWWRRTACGMPSKRRPAWPPLPAQHPSRWAKSFLASMLSCQLCCLFADREWTSTSLSRCMPRSDPTVSNCSLYIVHAVGASEGHHLHHERARGHQGRHLPGDRGPAAARQAVLGVHALLCRQRQLQLHVSFWNSACFEVSKLSMLQVPHLVFVCGRRRSQASMAHFMACTCRNTHVLQAGFQPLNHWLRLLQRRQQQQRQGAGSRRRAAAGGGAGASGRGAAGRHDAGRGQCAAGLVHGRAGGGAQRHNGEGVSCKLQFCNAKLDMLRRWVLQ